jgi:hypothetical protein
MGKLRLEQAMAQFKELSFEVRWLPYQLDANASLAGEPPPRRAAPSWGPPARAPLPAAAPPTRCRAAGVDKGQLYNSKFGAARVAQMVPHITGLFAEFGVKYSMVGGGGRKHAHSWTRLDALPNLPLTPTLPPPRPLPPPKQGGLTGNTFDSHRLIEWAGREGQQAQGALVAELFRAYFSEARAVRVGGAGLGLGG